MAASSFVQATRELPWLEPLEAWRRLRAENPTLLDGLGLHPGSKHAYLAMRPLVEVRLTGHDIEEHWADGSLEVAHEEPLAYLRHLTARFKFDLQENCGFTGGWVGYFGFGFTNAIEPTLPPARASSTADAALALMRDAVAFDREAGTVRLFCADLEGDAAACEARADELVRRWGIAAVANAGCATPGLWVTGMNQAEFEQAVVTAKRHIVEGDLFQVNLATRFSASSSARPDDLFESLQRNNPSPYMALMDLGGATIVSGSPELLFDVSEGRIRTRPIAGTRKRGRDEIEDAAMEAELVSDAKEQAEHTMLVDLLRNDLARVSRPGSVHVPELMSVERYRHVMHLASRVEGVLRQGTEFVDWLVALFPGGTVTGAPKVRACQRILELEPDPRGPYTGSAGYLSWSHNAQWNILIRGLVLQDGKAIVHAGSGIVADSDPAREWREAGRKAQAMLEAASGEVTTGNPTRLGEVTRHHEWSSPQIVATRKTARVLLIDNYDSFVHNIADYCAGLGAQVLVIRNDQDWKAAVAQFHATHIILSPGPGWPDDAGATLTIARELSGQIPILGICLGHQAIGQSNGFPVVMHPDGPVHGRPDSILHSGQGLFEGLPSPFLATRYHSLIVDGRDLGPDWVVDAGLADGTVMSLRHRTHPTFGLQFHPESLCTEHGVELLDKFLGTHA